MAKARGVTPEAFDGFDPAAYLPASGPGAAERSLDDLVAHNRRSAKTHSGIWRDLAVRRRATEVDAQLGIVATLGQQGGVATPLTMPPIRITGATSAGIALRPARTISRGVCLLASAARPRERT